MIDLMKSSGCVKLNFPVESGSQDIINNVIKKPLNLEKVRKLMAYCKSINLDYSMFLLIGLPGEKIADIWKSFSFAVKCGVYVPHISVATPYPGTELFTISKQNGYFVREFSLDDLFLRGYSIATPEWSVLQLKILLFTGSLYLRWYGFLNNPTYKIKILFKHPLKTFKNLFKV
jgi:anaerobic magnesium-protoporphyrin IX monomethyl ester cyclase